MVIGVKYCGGCNAAYDRIRQVELLKEQFPDITFRTNVQDEVCDIWLAVCGCMRACVSAECLKARNRVFLIRSAADFREVRQYLSDKRTASESEYGAGTGSEMKILRIGQTEELTKIFFRDDVEKFAVLTGDFNRIHTDASFAQTTIYQRPVVHGMLTASLISSVMGMKLPGEGTVLLEEHIRFLKPVFYGEKITARVRLKSCTERNSCYIGTLHGYCVNPAGDVAVEAECVQMMPKNRFFVSGI